MQAKSDPLPTLVEVALGHSQALPLGLSVADFRVRWQRPQKTRSSKPEGAASWPLTGKVCVRFLPIHTFHRPSPECNTSGTKAMSLTFLSYSFASCLTSGTDFSNSNRQDLHHCEAYRLHAAEHLFSKNTLFRSWLLDFFFPKPTLRPMGSNS